jgi:hypothetical protein
MVLGMPARRVLRWKEVRMVVAQALAGLELGVVLRLVVLAGAAAFLPAK